MHLEHVDVKESWVLEIETGDDRVCFILDARLQAQHSRFYWPPKDGEVGAYARIRWCFFGEVHWNERPNLYHPAIDASGEKDFGNIDVWLGSGSNHTLEGEWGSVVIRDARQTIEYLDGDPSSEATAGDDGP